MDIQDVLILAIGQLQREVATLTKAVSQLQRGETVGGGPVSEANITIPPTAAELTTAFGSPADITEGMLKWVDDGGTATSVILVVPIGGAWWYEVLTKAV